MKENYIFIPKKENNYNKLDYFLINNKAYTDVTSLYKLGIQPEELIKNINVSISEFNKNLKIGSDFKDFKIDNDLSFSNFIEDKENKSKYVFLLFWSASCPHCKQIIDYVKDNNLKNIFTVSIDKEEEDVNLYKNNFPILLDSDEEVFNLYRNTYVPTLYVIENNKIIDSLMYIFLQF